MLTPAWSVPSSGFEASVSFCITSGGWGGFFAILGGVEVSGWCC